ncbi:glycine decarboxylase subunit P [Maudiozyma exigua]|uniref:Glycine cleavage system P protein n=1 Tax=Maudiozyma exigua TaxID=34358 RepID=A0A9P6WB92_MAUEX|nr:glycine decarboxylase subunit P [Kazachstania exigua]
MGMIARTGIPLKWVSSIKTLQQRSFHVNVIVNQTVADITIKNLKTNYNGNKKDLSRELDGFLKRHIGPSPTDIQRMLSTLKYDDLSTFISNVIPKNVLQMKPLKLNAPDLGYTEQEMLKELNKIANLNNFKVKNLIGKGYYGTILPPVIQRNLLENPQWYTSYTPYQPEISQGRLESLLNFQTIITELTGLPIANASLLDEGTAAGEAMLLSFHQLKGKKKVYLIDSKVHKQTKSVLKTRAIPMNIEIKEVDTNNLTGIKEQLAEDNVSGILIQYPATDGSINSLDNLKQLSQLIHDKKGLVSVASDLMALTLLNPPSQFNADIVLGSSQRFGVPMGFGGPHAAFFSVTTKLSRRIPGRIVGVTKDRLGKQAYRLALQTREQHIKRDKATSNICTAQALLANIAAMFVVYHGPQGLRNISERIYAMTSILAKFINSEASDFKILNGNWFDTLTIKLPDNLNTNEILDKALKTYNTNLYKVDNNTVSLSVDETVTQENLENLIKLFAKDSNVDLKSETSQFIEFPTELKRTDNYLNQDVFNTYHNETAMLRYMTRLQMRDLSLANSMIPLGSCTMKLNATTEMIPITWPQFANIHPFQPRSQVNGYYELINSLEHDLCEITGFDDISLQPNAGAQGEFSGLRVLTSYLKDQGQTHRNICLIPVSAHGTNPASAAMCGLKVVPIACLKNGSLDLADLKAKAEQYNDSLAAVMITYPSTYGLYEPGIKDAIDIVHENGGQVYLDGANMNAQLGLTSPGFLGADVCHLNLHKTFAIPHGGGGPGVGAIGVKSHLQPFLPGHDITKIDSASDKSIDAVCSSAFGNSLVLPISFAFIKMLGNQGVPFVSSIAILNANYLVQRLKDHYKILFISEEDKISDHCAHEFIIDLREFKEQHVEAIDIAKRLQDYGFHAPTLAFPVPGTLMVEPTESEDLNELNRFVDAMISIRGEIDDFVKGDPKGMVLKNAPHSLEDLLVSEDWDTRGYTREHAAYPLPFLKQNKFWPVVTRVDDRYGDMNLMCTCPSVEEVAGSQK